MMEQKQREDSQTTFWQYFNDKHKKMETKLLTNFANWIRYNKRMKFLCWKRTAIHSKGHAFYTINLGKKNSVSEDSP